LYCVLKPLDKSDVAAKKRTPRNTENITYQLLSKQLPAEKLDIAHTKT